MNKNLKQTTFIILLVIGIVAILYFGSGFILPLAFAGLIAMLFTPLSNKLERHGIPRWGSISICVLILLTVVSVLAGVVVWQANSMIQNWSKVQEQFQKEQQQFEDYLVNTVGLSQEQVTQMENRISNQTGKIRSWAQAFFGSVFSAISNGFIFLIYLILLLLERERLYAFVVKAVPFEEEDKAEDVMNEARKIASKYFTGRLIIIAILAVAYAIGFMVSGINYAIPIAILAAVLSIVPYVGNIFGGLIAVAIGLVTGGGFGAIVGVLITMTVMQVIENYVLEPWIVGKIVTLNPLCTIVVVVGFSVMWGVMGTILSIPIAAIAKEFFDHIEDLKPIGFVMGTRKVET